MRATSGTRRSLAGCAAAAVALVCATARAGNDDETLLGELASRTAGAVTATVDDGAAVYYNPAGLTQVAAPTMNLTGSAFTLRFYSMPNLLQAPTGETSSARFMEFVTVPSTLSYVRPLGKRLSLGAGLFVTSVSSPILRSSLTYTTGGVREEWVVAYASRIRGYRLGPALGFRASNRLRLGASVLFTYDQAGGTVQFGGGQPDESGSSQFITVSDSSQAFAVGIQGNFGVQWAPHPRVRVGAALLTPAADVYSGTNESSVTSASLDQFGDGNQTYYLPVAEKAQGFSVAVALPLRARLGVAWVARWGTVSLDGDVQSSVESPNPEVERAPVWNARVGADLHVGKASSLGFGFFTDRSPAKSISDFQDRKLDFYGGTVGLELGRLRELSDTEDRERLRFSSTFALRYAYGSGQIGGVTVAPLANVATDLANTPTPLEIHELSLLLGASLAF